MYVVVPRVQPGGVLTRDTACVVEEFGRANLIDVIPPKASQIATICYTSVSELAFLAIQSYANEFSGYYRATERYDIAGNDPTAN